MTSLVQSDLEPMLQAVRLAAQLCQEVQRHYLIENQKEGHEPVTIADYGSQAILARAISLAFPDDAIIAEESATQFLQAVTEAQRAQIVRLVGQVLGEPVTEADMIRWLDHGRNRNVPRTWVIDPIDGTIGFLALRSYAIAVGVLENGQVSAALMGCPGYGAGRIFYAVGGVCYAMPLEQGQAMQVFVSQRVPPETMRVVESYESSHADHPAMARTYVEAGLNVMETVRWDGQDKYAMVACGDAELYLRISPKPDYRAKIWDHAAGAALVLAAGGMVTDAKGVALDFSQGQTLPPGRVVVASNGRIHEQILHALARLGI